MAPCAPRSAAVTGRLSSVCATTIRPSRSFRSAIEVARQNTAITSLAGTMSNPPSEGKPLLTPPRPVTIWRSARSLMSSTRRHVMRRWSMPSALPWKMWLSIMAASRLFAAAIALKSPVKCRLMSSIGMTCAYPPPAAPPFMPKTGPSAGSRRHSIAFSPSRVRASPSPTVVVVLPSPAGVGETAVMRISRPWRRGGSEPSTRSGIFALKRPYGSILSGSMPSRSAIVAIGSGVAAWAISILFSVNAGTFRDSSTHYVITLSGGASQGHIGRSTGSFTLSRLA